MSDQFGAALARAFGGGLVTGLLVLLTTIQQTAAADPARLEKAAIAGAIALLTYVATRGGVEGWIDTSRDNAGEVSRADVGGERLLAIEAANGR